MTRIPCCGGDLAADKVTLEVAEAKELFAESRFIEATAIVESRGGAVLFLYTAHLHAEVLGCAGHYYAVVGKRLAQKFAHLCREAFLHLQAAREVVNHTCELGEPYHLAARYIAYGYASEEGKYVVLAEGVELDVFNDNHAGTGMFEDSLRCRSCRVHTVTGGSVEHGFRCTDGRFHESFALGVFAEQTEYFFVVVGQLVYQFGVMRFFTAHDFVQFSVCRARGNSLSPALI